MAELFWVVIAGVCVGALVIAYHIGQNMDLWKSEYTNLYLSDAEIDEPDKIEMFLDDAADDLEDLSEEVES